MKYLLSALIFLYTIFCSATSKYETIVSNINVTKYNASPNYIVLVDYSKLSNTDRFFIWDIKKKKIIYSCWCAHGFGRKSTKYIPKFSNNIGSNCSSLGLFLIDKIEGTGATYGYKYHAVDGLSSTNSNARKRQLLIHPWGSVSQDSYNKISTPMECDYRSAGCFTITYEGYEKIHSLINLEKKRILLFAFYNYNF